MSLLHPIKTPRKSYPISRSARSERILKIIADDRELSGIWHVAADPISKFDLLTLVKQTYAS